MDKSRISGKATFPDALDTETKRERERRLERKREQSRRYRQEGRIRDVGHEAFGDPISAVRFSDGDEEKPREAVVFTRPATDRLDQIRDLAERGRRGNKYR